MVMIDDFVHFTKACPIKKNANRLLPYFAIPIQLMSKIKIQRFQHCNFSIFLNMTMAVTNKHMLLFTEFW